MVSLDVLISNPGRVVVYGRGGTLAGDLAAGLSGKFKVERVASLPEALHALVEPTLAMLIIPDEITAEVSPPDFTPLIKRAAARRCQVVVLGGDDHFDQNQVLHLREIPGPLELAARLEKASQVGKA